MKIRKAHPAPPKHGYNNHKLAVWISIRHLFNKHKNAFISLIASFSILGLIIGIASLITVLSVMNGFTEVISQKLFTSLPHITIIPTNKNFNDWQQLRDQLSKQPGITSVYTNIEGSLFTIVNNQITPIIIQAMPFDVLKNKLKSLKISLNPAYLDDTFKGLIISQKLADQLKIKANATINSLNPATFAANGNQTAKTDYVTIKVSDIFPVTDPLTSKIAFTTISSARRILNLPNNYLSSISISLQDPFQANDIADKLAQQLGKDGNNFQIFTWTDYFSHYFAALKFTKRIMFIVLSLIILVAIFNVFVTQIMVIKEKIGEIAILINLGCTNRLIFSVFFIQGLLISAAGTILGILVGYFLSNNISQLSKLLQRLVNHDLINASVYFVDHLPTKFSWHDVWLVGAFSLLTSILAVYFPASRAMKQNLAQTLHYIE